MSSPKLVLFIGGLSAFLSLVTILYYFTGLVGMHNLGVEADTEEKPKVVDPDEDAEEELVAFTRTQIGSYTVEMVSDIVMFVASIFLILGVKKQSYKFVAPWMYVFFLMIFFYCIDLFFETHTEKEGFARFITILLTLAMWYPVYRHYKHLKKACSANTAAAVQPCYAPANVYPCAPTAVYAKTTEFGQQHASAPAHE